MWYWPAKLGHTIGVEYVEYLAGWRGMLVERSRSRFSPGDLHGIQIDGICSAALDSVLGYRRVERRAFQLERGLYG